VFRILQGKQSKNRTEEIIAETFSTNNEMCQIRDPNNSLREDQAGNIKYKNLDKSFQSY
jgi:hypothetical protein